MIRTRLNYRVESVGRNVRLYRYENLDIAVSTFRRRTYINIYHHGTTEPLWLRVETSDGKLWDCDARDIDLLRARDPRARIIRTLPTPKPWCVLCKKAGL
jgi:hypothetical protein